MGSQKRKPSPQTPRKDSALAFPPGPSPVKKDFKSQVVTELNEVGSPDEECDYPGMTGSRSGTATKMRSQPNMSSAPKRKLTDYFKKLTTEEEKIEERKKSLERSKAIRAAIKQRELSDKAWRDIKKRELANERQIRKRKRDQAIDIEEGRRTPNGSKIKKPKVNVSSVVYKYLLIIFGSWTL